MRAIVAAAIAAATTAAAAWQTPSAQVPPSKLWAAQTAPKQITLSWTRGQRIRLYRLYEGPAATAKMIGTINTSGDQFVRPVTAYGVAHQFAIEAIFEDGTLSSRLAFNPVVPREATPGVVTSPAAVRVATAEGGALTIDWDPVPDATAYLITRQVAPGGFQILCRLCPATTSYVDTTATGGARHTYGVAAITPAGTSRPTRSNEVLTTGPPPTPKAPAPVARAAPPKGTLRLTPVPGGCLQVGSEGNVIVRMADGSVRFFERVNFGKFMKVMENPSFKPVEGISNAVAVATSGRHSLALIGDGTVRAFGRNDNGQLGDREFHDFRSDVPLMVGTITNAVSVAAGTSHSAAVLADGTIRVWGDGSRGVPGSGNDVTTNRLVPGAVTGIANARTIVAGAYTNFALLADGTLRAWGLNWGGLSFFGVLGAGPDRIDHSTTPLPVLNITNAIAITTNGGNSLAILADRTVMGWGRVFAPLRGQAENFLTTSRPMPVPGIRNAVAVSPLLILLADGTVRDLHDPETPVAGIRDAVAVTSDITNRYALLADGRLMGWGLKQFWPKGMITVAEFGAETARACSARSAAYTRTP